MLKILLFDIETSPSIGYIWSLWSEVRSFSFVERDWFVLCWAAKWLGSKEILSSSLPEFKEYKKDPENDKQVLLKLWTLLDEADIVIAHNGINFDRKKVNARFMKHGINPPSPYRVIDTLMICRKEFAFTSNRLNDLGQMLGVGKKVETGGFQLWKLCLKGDLKAWAKMVKYCRGDIRLLERIYLKIRPYAIQHPNVSVDHGEVCCPKCASTKIHYRGYCFTNMSKFRRFQCMKCGGWGRRKFNEVEKENRDRVTVNA